MGAGAIGAPGADPAGAGAATPPVEVKVKDVWSLLKHHFSNNKVNKKGGSDDNKK